MSKVILVCSKSRSENRTTKKDITRLSERLVPGDISYSPIEIIERNGIVAGIIDPRLNTSVKNGSICIGYMVNPSGDWERPGAQPPDGAYAMFRSDEKSVELLTDSVGSRTIWYYQTASLFVASTNQRAIVYFIQSFELNPTAVQWMISSGSPGAGNSWDKRIKVLPPDTSLRLDRKSWNLSIDQNQAVFHKAEKNEKEFAADLKEAISDSIANVKLDLTRWALPLSGGYDSRELLLHLKERKDLQCLIWGMKSDLVNPDSDAAIAVRLAEHFKIPYRYLELDPSREPLDNRINKFIYANEGRTDNIAHYLDGFRMWSSLANSGVEGILKGDEAFGWFAVADEKEARHSVRGQMLESYRNTEILSCLISEKFGRQSWPERLKRNGNSTLAEYRDYLYHATFPSTHLAAWNETRRAYVEILQPYLSRRIINVVRTMPDSMRTNKALYKKIVASESPSIPFAAKLGSAYYQRSIFDDPEFNQLISDTLSSSFFRNIFSGDIIDHILENWAHEKRSSGRPVRVIKGAGKKLLPRRLQMVIKRRIKPGLSYKQIAFRTYLTGNIIRMYGEDAGLLKNNKA